MGVDQIERSVLSQMTGPMSSIHKRDTFDLESILDDVLKDYGKSNKFQSRKSSSNRGKKKSSKKGEESAGKGNKPSRLGRGSAEKGKKPSRKGRGSAEEENKQSRKGKGSSKRKPLPKAEEEKGDKES